MTILFVWAIITTNTHTSHWGWKALQEFSLPERCVSVAQVLGLDPKTYRCVKK